MWKPKQDEENTIFMGGLPLSADWQLVHSYLQQFGTVHTLYLPRCRKTGRIKGYAKASFVSAEAADRLLAQPTHMLASLSVGISLWKRKADYIPLKDEQRLRKVYVKFEHECSAHALRAYLSQFGKLQELDLRLDPITQQPRNFCYVVYETAEAAQQVANMRIHSFSGTTLTCEMSKPIHPIQSNPQISKQASSKLSINSKPKKYSQKKRIEPGYNESLVLTAETGKRRKMFCESFAKLQNVGTLAAIPKGKVSVPKIQTTTTRSDDALLLMDQNQHLAHDGPYWFKPTMKIYHAEKRRIAPIQHGESTGNLEFRIQRAGPLRN